MVLLFWGIIIGLIGRGVYVCRKAVGGTPRVNAVTRDNGKSLIWTGALLGFIFLTVCLAQPFASGRAMARYMAFYDANYYNYRISVDETAAYLSSEEFVEGSEDQLRLVDGSVEKWGQTAVVSERLKEWRDAVNQYNVDVAQYRFYSTHWLVGVLHPDLPDEIKLLVVVPGGG